MSLKEASKGRIPFAYELLNRAMSYVIDDTCLKGISWVEIPNCGIESVILNAAGLLYSGRPARAAQLIEQNKNQLQGNFTALFIKARACESCGDMPGFYQTYCQPEYDKLYIALRHIVRAKHIANQDEAETVANRLLSMLYNNNVTAEEFVDAIREEREAHSFEWNSFKSQILKLG